MASVIKSIAIEVPAAFAWAAIEDVGAIHTRLARGFAVATSLEPGARTVTFANGVTVKELILGLSREHMRLAYAVVGISATHYSASLEVSSTTDGACYIKSTTDLLPEELAARVAAMVEPALQSMKRTLEADFGLSKGG